MTGSARVRARATKRLEPRARVATSVVLRREFYDAVNSYRETIHGESLFTSYRYP